MWSGWSRMAVTFFFTYPWWLWVVIQPVLTFPFPHLPSPRPQAPHSASKALPTWVSAAHVPFGPRNPPPHISEMKLPLFYVSMMLVDISILERIQCTLCRKDICIIYTYILYMCLFLQLNFKNFTKGRNCLVLFLSLAQSAEHCMDGMPDSIFVKRM